MNVIYLAGLILLAFFAIPVSTLRKQVRPEEYLGCYTISEERRTFLSSPGDYNMKDISPLHCLRQCGKKYYYATLQEGNICLCANSLPTVGKVDDSECNMKCPGHQNWPSEAQSSLRCGGRLHNSIYSASERILGLSLVKSGRLPVLKPIIISGNMVNGMNVTFSFILGDGSRTMQPSDQPEVRHIYDQPGSYIVSMEATNPVTGTITVSELYDVDDPLGPVELHCPRSVPLGSWVECNGSVIRGTRINNTFSFEDGQYESISLSSRYYSVGPNIPRENNSLSYNSSSPQGTIVFPAYEFRHDGRVAEWEFEAVKAGNIKLQIFRPRCSSSESYCLSNKSCFSDNETCQPTNKNKCQPSEIFCIFRRRCIANSTESKISCAPLAPYQTDAPRADYELISENRITVDTIGHHIKSLPIGEQPTVKQGDILGWISEGGELAFKVVTTADGAAFEFEYSSHPKVGEKLLRTSNPNTHHRHYIMAAHYVHAADFVIRHLYNSTGMKRVTSNITQTLLVGVDIPVGDLVTMTHPSVVNSHDPVVFNIPWHSGSNITFIWDFGDGKSLRSQINSTSHTYRSSGTYYVTLTVANSVNQKILHAVIAVFDFIRGLQFSKPIKAKAIGLATEIEWESTEGTNITYVVDFGDGSPRFETVTTLERSRKGFITHKYAAVGNYTVTVFAFNLVGPNISISSQALVEIPVAEVHFSLPADHVTQTVFFAVGDVVTVNRIVSNGTNVKCAFDFKDGSPVTISTEHSTSHVYNDTGAYKVEINCYNAVNSVKRLLNATVQIQNLEKITGLVLRASPTTFGADSAITVQMDSGTTFFCTIGFGDGERLRIDFSHVGQELYHRFPAVGSYNVSVACQNRLGAEEYTLVHDVDIPIKDVTITSNIRFIRVHENVSVDVTVKKGSRIKYTWFFGDGRTYNAHRTTADVSEPVSRAHAFSNAGNFPVNVSISNSLSTVSVLLPYTLVAEYPVTDIALTTNSPVRLNPGHVTFELSLLANVTPPTDAVCVWDFKDGSAPSSSQRLEISPLKPHEHTHTFKQEGTFTASVNISNNVSSLVLSSDVDVQRLIDVSLTLARLEGGVRSEGFGETKNYFRADEVVYFNVTSQPKDLSYVWDFGDGLPLNTTTEPHTSHIYSRSGTYKVKVTVFNILARMSATKDITIQRAVGEISITSSYPTYNGDPTYFTIDIEDPGTDTCLTLDHHDSYKRYFGDERCRPRVLSPKYIFHRLYTNQTQVNVTHVYDAMGSYAAKLTASNVVSTKVASTLVNITSNPCDVPTVRIVGDDGSSHPPTKIRKSESLLLKPKVTYRCPVASSLVFTWSAFEVTLVDLQNESKPLELPEDLVRKVDLPATEVDLEATDLSIKERKLPFGLIKFNLKLGFMAKDRDLSEIFGTHTVWIEVERSELSAVIRGSIQRSIGYQKPLTLDASNSKDPDMPGDMTGITFTWMCRRKGEKFPESDSLPSSNGGCWENGTFVFGGNNKKIEVYTGDFYQKSFYVFRVIISKDTRTDEFDQSVEILVGQPPTSFQNCAVTHGAWTALTRHHQFLIFLKVGWLLDYLVNWFFN